MKLDAIEVLYMQYITERTTDEARKYDFWQSQYGRTAEDLLHHLLDKGIIYEDDSLPVTLPKLRTFELKHILKSAGLKISGNKPELIKRILQYATEIDFDSMPLKNVYKLSDTHTEFYSRTSFLNYFHFHGNFDLHEVYDFYLVNEDLDNHRIAVEFLEEQVRYHLYESNKYTAIKSYYLLSNYALDEIRDLNLSMYYLNHFTMLVVLAAMHRKSGDGTAAHFDIDAHTADRYRAFMASERMDTDDMVQYLVDSTGGLPYSEEACIKAAGFITDSINDRAC